MSDADDRPAVFGRAELAALGAVVIWGASFVATKAALRELEPIPLVVIRFGLGIFFLLAVHAWRRESPLPPRSMWKSLALMGFVGIFVHQVLQAYGLRLTTATNTGWLIGLIPLWSALLAAAWLGESLGRGRALGLAVGFLGALVLITRGRLFAASVDLPSTRGDLLILVSTVNWAVYTVLGRATLRELGALRATSGSMIFGWAMLAIAGVVLGGIPSPAAISHSTWAALVFLGVGSSGIGYLLWYGALERLEASRVAAFLYVEPLATLVTARATLGEPIEAVTIAGGLLVLLGVAIIQRSA